MRRLASLCLVLALAACGESVQPTSPIAPDLSRAASPHYFDATFEGPTTGFIRSLTVRGPSSSSVIETTARRASEELATERGPLSLTGEHCSRWLNRPPEGNGSTPGKIGAGEMTMDTPEGELTLAYEGTFVLRGDPSIGPWVTKVNSKYRIMGGTGVFAGASGQGHIWITDSSGYGSGHLQGSMVYRD